MTKRPTLGQRLRYAFDNTLARGPAALIMWLAVATLILIAFAVIVDLLVGGTSDSLGPVQVFWNIIFQALVPNPPGDLNSPWQFILVMLAVTLASLIMVSILIGLLSAEIQNCIDILRRGRSQVIETNHTVILGWTEQVFAIVAELVIANQNQRRTAIAILGDRDQVEMEDELRHRIRHTGRTRVVCRRGSPTEHADLDLVSPQTAKSVIILPDDDEQHPDATTIKAILALTKAANRRAEPYQIVTVLRKESNEEIARLVGGAEVELILSGSVIAKIIAQTCRQAGLSLVYTELLDFEGDEIYFQAEPALVGRTYGEALLAYADSAVIGIHTAAGEPLLNPPMATPIRDGDRIIAISEDDDTVRLSGLAHPPIQADAIVGGQPSVRAPERTLILGWNWRAPIIIGQLDAYVTAGSHVTVVAQHDDLDGAVTALAPTLVNQTLDCLSADISSRQVLDSLQVGSYDHVIILCYSDRMDSQRADAVTLLTLLHLRRIAEESGHSFSLVSEMMDERNRNLAANTRADDFIVSDRMISLLLVQVSENRALNAVFDDLLDPRGAEIFLKPAGDYVKQGMPVTFYTVVESARHRGESAIGYRLVAQPADGEHADGVVVNPDKGTTVTFGAGDQIIVLAES